MDRVAHGNGVCVMGVYFLGGKVVFQDSKVAFHQDCCTCCPECEAAGVGTPDQVQVVVTGLSVTASCHQEVGLGYWKSINNNPMNDTFLLDKCGPDDNVCIYHFSSTQDDHDHENYGLGDTGCSTLTSTHTYRYRLTCFLDQSGLFRFRCYYWMERTTDSTENISLAYLDYTTSEIDNGCEEVNDGIEDDATQGNGHQGFCSDSVITSGPANNDWISGTPHLVVSAVYN